MAKFSIIVPVYNVENYLRFSLDSILMQEYKDFELILVDDGSTDGSGKICDEYGEKDPRVIVIHKENGGLSDSRNRGIDKSSGEYIIFIDSDDWIEEGCLEKFSQILKDKTPDVLVTRMYEVCDDTPVLKDQKLEEYLKTPLTSERAASWIVNHSETSWPAQKLIVSREFINRNNLRFLKGYLHEDIDWTCNIMYKNPEYMATATPWYYHRKQRPGSITTNISLKNVKDVFDIASIHYEHYVNRETKLDEDIFTRIMLSLYCKINEAIYLNKEDKKEFAKILNSRKEMFKIAPAMKYKLFSVCLRVFGAGFAINLLTFLGKGR